MKKALVILCLVVLGLSFKGYSQDDFGHNLNVFISPSYYEDYGVTLTADYEVVEFGHGFTLAPSLGVGVFSKSKPVLILHPGATVYYYFDAVLKRLPNMLDFYTKLTLGFWFPLDEDYRDYSIHFPLTYAAFIGGRVHFNEKISLNLGIGLNRVTAYVGLTRSF